MTERETIIKHIEENNNRIENIKFFMSSNPDANIDDCKRNIDVLIVSNNALEKQIPKKPIFSEDKQFALCPCCDMKGLTDKQEYCDDCGQAIDWSDTE